MAKSLPVVLSIAGFDPSSGAGVTADIKAISAHGCYGVGCVTALTVQSTSEVRRVEPIDPKLVRETLTCLTDDFEIAAVRVGMLGSGAVADAVADFLHDLSSSKVVLDPVIVSSSGAKLVDDAGISVVLRRLLPMAAVITPNIHEASALTGIEVVSADQMQDAASKLHELGAKAVVVTGGHLDKAIDLLSFQDRSGIQRETFKSEKLRSNSTHGTGCAFASAIACHLAHGRGLPEAVLLAKAYIVAAIANGVPVGKGIGPVNHLYRMNEQRRAATADVGEPVAH
ncbi:MAG: bifunctional hydroxymethylpyrimidine kinase/phosphomethylpyrimidine kinase [Terriglobales bacterium]